MQGTDTTLILIDLEIKRRPCTLCKEKREELQATEEVKKEKLEMVTPPHQSFGDYYRRTEFGQICLGFQPENSVTFDLKSYVLTSLKENLLKGKQLDILRIISLNFMRPA